MGKQIPTEIIEQIRNSLDIIEVISEYVQLKRKGRNYFGLCPIHGEKTPSFSVSAEKQLFHCFGCGASGNVFSFIMEVEGMSFFEAVVKLSNKAGIDISIDSSSISNRTSHLADDLQQMIQAHELLQKLYHHLLLNTNEGKEALQYLYKRGVTEDVIKKFQIGYSPDSWDLQTTYLKRRGFSLENMERAGLLAKRGTDGTYLDRFRNRVMFPIWNSQGRTIAFGGRILQEEDEPKYLNSPDSPIFQKGNILFPFHIARQGIRKTKKVVLFEGYMDLISAWNAGVENGIASLGTSLTENQVNVIRRVTDSVTICYDADSAGKKAALRSAELLTANGCHVEIASLPDGFDPDDYIRKYGASSFLNGVIGDCKTVTTFKIEYLRSGINLKNEGERIRYIEEVIKEIAILPMAVERDHYIRQIANEFSLSIHALEEQMNQIQQDMNESSNKRYPRGNDAKKNYGYTQRLLPAFHNAERMLIAHMLKDERVAWKVEEDLGCSFNIDEHNAIAILLYAFYEESNEPNVSRFIERVHDKQLRSIVSDIAMLSISDETKQEEINDYIKMIRNHQKLLQIEEIEKEKKEAEMKKDFIKAAEIAMEIIRKRQELKGS